MKKEKVVAVRLTTEQYEALEWARVNTYADEKASKTMSQFVALLLKRDINIASKQRDAEMQAIELAAAIKKAEAAAKRKAKKAANDTK